MILLQRVPRRLIQLTCFVGALVLVWPLLPWVIAPRFFQQISPSSLSPQASRGVPIGVGAVLALIVAVVSSFKKRWFCLYLCPTGFLLESTSRVGLRRTRWWAKLPPVGRYFAILTLVGAVAGYPVLMWMDPLCIFSSPFAVDKATNPISVFLVCLGLGVLVGATFVFGMAWCVRICPLSGLQDMLFYARKALWTRLTASAPPQKSVGARRAFFAGAGGALLALGARRLGAARYRKRYAAASSGRRARGPFCRPLHPLQQLRPRVPIENHPTGYRPRGRAGGLRRAHHSIRPRLQILPGNVQRLHAGLPHRRAHTASS